MNNSLHAPTASRSKSVFAMALICIAFLGGCGGNDQGGSGNHSPRVDLQAAYDRLVVGDSIQVAESLLGTASETRRTNVLIFDCTTLVYFDVLRGKSLVLYFSLNRLVLKRFEDRAVPFFNFH